MRTNGFSSPLHPLQITSWFLFASFLVGYAIFFVPPLASNLIIPLAIVYGVLIGTVCWTAGRATSCNPIDPLCLDNTGKPTLHSDEDLWAREKRSRQVIEGRVWCSYCAEHVGIGSKHCRVCDKCVGEFDHHCKWLNNCIGGKNYRSFFVAITSVLMLMIFQIGVGIHIMVESFDSPAELESRMHVLFDHFHINALRTVIAVYLLPLTAVALSITQLFVIHIYLFTRKMSTYEWILERRQKIREREEAEIARLANRGNTTPGGRPAAAVEMTHLTSSHTTAPAKTATTTTVVTVSPAASSVPLPVPTLGGSSDIGKSAWSHHDSSSLPTEVKIHHGEDTTSTPVVSTPSLRAEGQPLALAGKLSGGVGNGSAPLTPSDTNALSPRSARAVSLHTVHAGTLPLVAPSDPHRTPSPSLLSPSTPVQHHHHHHHRPSAVSISTTSTIPGGAGGASGGGVTTTPTFINALPPVRDEDEVPLSHTPAVTRHPLQADSPAASTSAIAATASIPIIAPQSSPKLRPTSVARVHSRTNINNNNEESTHVSIHHDKPPSLPGMMDEPSSPPRGGSNPQALDSSVAAVRQSTSHHTLDDTTTTPPPPSGDADATSAATATAATNDATATVSVAAGAASTTTAASDSNGSESIVVPTIHEGKVKGLSTHHSSHNSAGGDAPLSPSSAHIRSVSINRSNGNAHQTTVNVSMDVALAQMDGSAHNATINMSVNMIIPPSPQSSSSSSTTAATDTNTSSSIASSSSDTTSSSGAIARSPNEKRTSANFGAPASSAAAADVTSPSTNTSSTDNTRRSARLSGTLPPVQLPGRRYTPAQPLNTPSSLLRPLSNPPLANTPPH